MRTTERAEWRGLPRHVALGPAVAIWASCLFGGVVLGMVTDRDPLSSGAPAAGATADTSVPAGSRAAPPAGHLAPGRDHPGSTTTTTAPAGPAPPVPVVVPDVLGDEDAVPLGVLPLIESQMRRPAGETATTTTTSRHATATSTTATTAPAPSSTTSSTPPSSTTTTTLLPGIPLAGPG